MPDYLNIAGRVRTTAADGVVAEAQEVKDLLKNKSQQELNNDFSTAIEAILLLIPSSASSLNQLADKAFVNSSIATASATFRGTYNLVSDLNLTVSATHAQIGAALAGAVSNEDNNDYAFVQVPTSDATPTQIAKTERYKFNGTTWEYEYDLNNSGYTDAQWAAINSGITAALVSKLSALPTNAELTTALGLLSDGIAAINGKIPSEATTSNKLVDTAAMQSYVTQIINAIDATFNVGSADGHVSVQITQVNGVITSVAVNTSDIASAAALTLVTGRVTDAEANIVSLGGRMTTAEDDIDDLQQLYNNLQQSAPVVIEPTDTWPVAVADRSATVIYRVVDRVNTPPQYYSDYMFRASDLSGQPVLMAQYNNAIDPRPKKGSQNLVTSGGVFDNMGALDVSELNATENPHTIAIYADLSAALAAIPSDYQKGGMSIKFIQGSVGSSDNKYVQCRCIADEFTTDTDEWVFCEDNLMVENPEYVLVFIDKEKKILFGVKKDNDFYFGNGCPKQVKEYVLQHNAEILSMLADKVDKEAGKGLIQIEVAENIHVIENPEYAGVEIGVTGELLGGRKKNGTKFENMPIQTPAITVISRNNPEYLDAKLDNKGRIFEGTKKNGKKYFPHGIEGFEDDVKKIVKGLKLDANIWTGKKIAWYGTSIPLGGSNPIPITGNAINAYIYYNAMVRYEKGQWLPAEHPVIAASLLGADTIWNESQGSSRITRNTSSTNILLRCLSLGNTVLENISYIWGCYNIDTVNKTFSRNLNNTVGITTFYASQYEASWNAFVTQTLFLIKNSYELRLMANFLVKDATQHSSFVTSVFGEYYSQITSMLSDIGMTMEDYAGYKDDIDLFVVEHSVNDDDIINTSTSVDTDDIDTFPGAYNKILNIIRMYKSNVRIAIVSNYMNLSSKDVIGYLHDIAERWSIPFIDMRGYSQVSSAKQTTQGYWDAQGYWHESGFEWSENVGADTYTTNCVFPADISSPSLAQMKLNVNPHQVNGVWFWESASLYQWCADGLHPHSDKGGRLTMLTGKVLAEWLKTIESIN